MAANRWLKLPPEAESHGAAVSIKRFLGRARCPATGIPHSRNVPRRGRHFRCRRHADVPRRRWRSNPCRSTGCCALLMQSGTGVPVAPVIGVTTTAFSDASPGAAFIQPLPASLPQKTTRSSSRHSWASGPSCSPLAFDYTNVWSPASAAGRACPGFARFPNRISQVSTTRPETGWRGAC